MEIGNPREHCCWSMKKQGVRDLSGGLLLFKGVLQSMRVYYLMSEQTNDPA